MGGGGGGGGGGGEVGGGGEGVGREWMGKMHLLASFILWVPIDTPLSCTVVFGAFETWKETRPMISLGRQK